MEPEANVRQNWGDYEDISEGTHFELLTIKLDSLIRGKDLDCQWIEFDEQISEVK
jgi:hypothetical protein